MLRFGILLLFCGAAITNGAASNVYRHRRGRLASHRRLSGANATDAKKINLTQPVEEQGLNMTARKRRLQLVGGGAMMVDWSSDALDPRLGVYCPASQDPFTMEAVRMDKYSEDKYAEKAELHLFCDCNEDCVLNPRICACDAAKKCCEESGFDRPKENHGYAVCLPDGALSTLTGTYRYPRDENPDFIPDFPDFGRLPDRQVGQVIWDTVTFNDGEDYFLVDLEPRGSVCYCDELDCLDIAIAKKYCGCAEAHLCCSAFTRGAAHGASMMNTCPLRDSFVFDPNTQYFGPPFNPTVTTVHHNDKIMVLPQTGRVDQPTGNQIYVGGLKNDGNKVYIGDAETAYIGDLQGVYQDQLYAVRGPQKFKRLTCKDYAIWNQDQEGYQPYDFCAADGAASYCYECGVCPMPERAPCRPWCNFKKHRRAPDAMFCAWKSCWGCKRCHPDQFEKYQGPMGHIGDAMKFWGYEKKEYELGWYADDD